MSTQEVPSSLRGNGKLAWLSVPSLGIPENWGVANRCMDSLISVDLCNIKLPFSHDARYICYRAQTFDGSSFASYASIERDE
jgi:hypothetical protein